MRSAAKKKENSGRKHNQEKQQQQRSKGRGGGAPSVLDVYSYATFGSLPVSSSSGVMDTVGEEERRAWALSPLEIALEDTETGHEFVELPVVKEVVRNTWQQQLRGRYCKQLVLYLAFAALFFISIQYGPCKNSTEDYLFSAAVRRHFDPVDKVGGVHDLWGWLKEGLVDGIHELNEGFVQKKRGGGKWVGGMYE